MARIEVRATQKGFFLQIRMPGEVFIIDREGAFSENWMERISPLPAVEDKKPELVAVAADPAPVEDKPKRKYVRKTV